MCESAPQVVGVFDLISTWPAAGEVHEPAEAATTRNGVCPAVEPYDCPQNSWESPLQRLPPRAARFALTMPWLFFQVSESIRSGSLGASVVLLPNWMANLVVVTVWVVVLIVMVTAADPVAIAGTRSIPAAAMSTTAPRRVRVFMSNPFPAICPGFARIVTAGPSCGQALAGPGIQE